MTRERKVSFMSALQQFEDFVERMVEGSITRLFRSPIQPVEIERRLVRVMETQPTISAGRTYVPNRYRVLLHPEDYKAVEPQRPLWEREITEFIIGICQERNYTLVSRPVVTITDSTETPRRSIHISATLQATATEGLDALEQGPIQPTTAMPIVRPGATAAPGRSGGSATPPPLCLQVLNGHMAGAELLFTRPLITVGRELDNDVVIEDSRVSRHHAQLLYQHGRYILRDLGSTNGTFVNAQPIESMMLASGDLLSLGGVEVQFTLT
jgi:hypothetical protein